MGERTLGSLRADRQPRARSGTRLVARASRRRLPGRAVLLGAATLAWVALGHQGLAGGTLPAGFPLPVIPVDNPLTEAKVELGRHLFFDVRLSVDGSYACATCHQPERAFTDGRSRAVGVTGDLHPRSAMSLANVAYNATLTWADPNLRRLEEQMRTPMFSTEPVEMGLAGLDGEVESRLRREPRYGPLFHQAFPEQDQPITLGNVILAIASFERTLISASSPYDRYVYWDEKENFPESARRGMRLFFSPRLGCFQCHAGFNLSGPVIYRDSPGTEPVFHNTGLYDLDGSGTYPAGNQGLYEHSRRPRDRGRFRAPTLRNIALTAPYMHDGSVPTLAAVIEHYAAGGRRAENPIKSSMLEGFEISQAEKADLVSFLDSLTDRKFVGEARFTDPWNPKFPP